MRNLHWIFLLFFGAIFAQPIPVDLNIDSSFAIIQGYSEKTLTQFKRQFDQINSEKFVVLHYGGSHIQAENPTTVVRNRLQEKFGSGGRGLLFSYSAANTYNSINYTSTHTGKWTYNKSYQGKKAGLPLGICGMVVETMDSIASLTFSLKAAIPPELSQITVFFENDSLSTGVDVFINGTKITNQITAFKEGISFPWQDSITRIKIAPKFSSIGIKRFRFYGVNVEHVANKGVVYHSTGVGAAAFRSILLLEKLEQHVPIIKPDLVILDFGTNDILYHNKVEPSLTKEVEQAIHWWRSMQPEILILLTSTQDLYYKKHSITAGISFRNVMDSLARKNDCLFWNWYDLSGGINTIRTWASLGYAKSDHIHLTKAGYQIKGGLLFTSMMNTLDSLSFNPQCSSLTVPMKQYETANVQVIPINPQPASVYYSVKSGDTLSAIANKYSTTVAKIKARNGLSSDKITVGQRLVIP